MAAFILNAMGLKSRIAPIVLLAGHGSSTVNNPQRAGLDCGACAGQTGEASVRMAAAILNDPAVRATLAGCGQPIPDDTRFLPALHDTTTDEVHLLDTVSVPRTLRPAVDRLRTALDRAGDIARLERIQLLCEHPPADAARALADLGPRGGGAPVLLALEIIRTMDRQGAVIQAESDHPLFPRTAVQTSPGILGSYGEHPARICASVAFELSAQDSGEKLEQLDRRGLGPRPAGDAAHPEIDRVHAPVLSRQLRLLHQLPGELGGS